jgi:hypothetical protein
LAVYPVDYLLICLRLPVTRMLFQLPFSGLFLVVDFNDTVYQAVLGRLRHCPEHVQEMEALQIEPVLSTYLDYQLFQGVPLIQLLNQLPTFLQLPQNEVCVIELTG